MPLVSPQRMLRQAQREQFAVGHFNTSNLEFTQAIIAAAERTGSPVMIATSKSAISYAGYAPLHAMVSALAKQASVPVALHLDHGPDHDHVRNCVKHGWTSVMRDASHLPYAENVREVRRAVALCGKHGIPVEGELGQLKGEEGWVKSREHVFTDPEQARDFVQRTGCASLAVSIGTSHGAYKFTGEPKLDLKRLSQIDDVIDIPLVLHGASGVPQDLLKQANALGAKIPHAQGVPDSQLRAAIRRGVCKVNTDTDLRIAFDASIRQVLSDRSDSFDPRDILGAVRDDLQRLVEKRMKVLGSAGRA